MGLNLLHAQVKELEIFVHCHFPVFLVQFFQNDVLAYFNKFLADLCLVCQVVSNFRQK